MPVNREGGKGHMRVEDAPHDLVGIGWDRVERLFGVVRRKARRDQHRVAAALIPLGLFILWLGTRREAAAGFVWLVIAGNVAWVLALALAEWAGLRVAPQAA